MEVFTKDKLRKMEELDMVMVFRSGLTVLNMKATGSMVSNMARVNSTMSMETFMKVTEI